MTNTCIIVPNTKLTMEELDERLGQARFKVLMYAEIVGTMKTGLKLSAPGARETMLQSQWLSLMETICGSMHTYVPSEKLAKMTDDISFSGDMVATTKAVGNAFTEICRFYKLGLLSAEEITETKGRDLFMQLFLLEVKKEEKRAKENDHGHRKHRRRRII